MSVLLVDTSWLMYRSLYTFKLSSKRAGIEVPTGHIYGVIRAAKSLKYDKILFVKDNYPRRRHELYPTYKERDGKNGLVHADVSLLPGLFTNLSNVRVVEAYEREADEVIGFLAHNLSGPVTVYTGDADMLQLIDLKNVSVGNIVSKGKVVSLTSGHVEQKFGVLPKQLPLYRTLVGDSSDKIRLFPRFSRALAKTIVNYALTPEEFQESYSKIFQCLNSESYKTQLTLARRSFSLIKSVFYDLVYMGSSDLTLEDVKDSKIEMDYDSVIRLLNVGYTSTQFLKG